MAGSITQIGKLSCTINGATYSTTGTTTKTVAMSSTAVNAVHGTQYVGTSEEALLVEDVDITNATGEEYMVELYNRHATAIVTAKIKTAATPTYWTCCILRPGESWHSRLPKLDGSTLGGVYLLSDTAATPVERVVCEAGDPAL